MSLVLRPPTPADAVRWWQTAVDPEQRQLGAPAFVAAPRSPEDVAVRLSVEPPAPIQPQSYVVVDDDAPEHLLGDVGWRWAGHEQLGVADIGYSVHPDARRRGVARGAIALIFELLTADPLGPRLARVQLDHSIENPASCRAASAAGLAIEGRRPAFLPLRGADGVVRHHTVCLHGRVSADVDPTTGRPVSGA